MSIEKATLEVLKAGLDDTMNLMDEEAMDLIEGGGCTGYCSGTYCQSNYSADDSTTPGSTPKPSILPTPTCECGADCSCKNCGCK
jgi:hypothetical protein